MKLHISDSARPAAPFYRHGRHEILQMPTAARPRATPARRMPSRDFRPQRAESLPAVGRGRRMETKNRRPHPQP